MARDNDKDDKNVRLTKNDVKVLKKLIYNARATDTKIANPSLPLFPLTTPENPFAS